MESNEIILYNAKELTKILRCGMSNAYALMNTSGFPSIKIGGKYFVEKVHLSKWLEKNKGKKIFIA